MTFPKDRLFDISGCFEKDRVLWGAATGAATMTVFIGFRLVATADLGTTAGLLRAGGGVLLWIAAAVGFRAYWVRM